MDPYHPVAVHIVYDSNVGKPFAVAGLIHTDTPEIVHPHGYVRLNAVVGSPDTVPNRPPVNVFKQRDGCPGHPANHPGDFIIEVLCKAALAICPGNAFSQYTVFGAFDPPGPVADVNRNAIEIRGTP
jgi:hypothetical protein